VIFEAKAKTKATKYVTKKSKYDNFIMCTKSQQDFKTNTRTLSFFSSPKSNTKNTETSGWLYENISISDYTIININTIQYKLLSVELLFLAQIAPQTV